MKKAFVDLDGTLIDSKARHISVLQMVFDEFLIKNTSVNDFVQYKSNGFSTKDYLENILQITPVTAEKISLRWMELIEVNEEIAKDVWYEDALSFLTFLKKNKYYVIVVSARKNKDGLLKFIEKSQINDLLDEIIVVSPVEAKENKEKYILQSLRDINIVVGDTEADYVEDVRIKNFLLNRGFRSKKYWEEKNIKSFDSLLEVIFEIQKGDHNIKDE